MIRDQNLEGKWADKVVLVTGPTSGIGLETAKALHATGAKLVLAGLRIQQDKAALGAAAEGALLVEMDLADPVSIKKAASEIIAGTQKLNVAIFNAGWLSCRDHCWEQRNLRTLPICRRSDEIEFHQEQARP